MHTGNQLAKIYGFILPNLGHNLPTIGISTIDLLGYKNFRRSSFMEPFAEDFSCHCLLAWYNKLKTHFVGSCVGLFLSFIVETSYIKTGC